MPGTKGRACLGEAAAHLACDPGVASDVFFDVDRSDVAQNRLARFGEARLATEQRKAHCSHGCYERGSWPYGASSY